MFLELINRSYWTIGFVLYICFSVSIKSSEYFYMYIVSFATFFILGIIINIWRKSISNFTRQNLFFTVLVSLIIESTLIQMVSFYIDGDTFIFSKIDALIYYRESLKMCKMSIIESFRYLTNNYDFDDWGTSLWISSIFRIIPSKLFLNFSYYILSSISAIMMFDIGRCLMPKRYAYIAALTFSVSSFSAAQGSMVSKEIITVFLVITSFYLFYSFLRRKNKIYLVCSLLFPLLLLFFRIPVALLLIFSFGLTLILMYSKRIFSIILGGILLLMIYSSSFFTMTYERYLRGGDTEAIIEQKMEMAGGGGVVNQMADPLAALAGPFPSIMMHTIKNTSLFASGLLYRVLLTAPFFLGVYYAFRHKYQRIYPLIFFFLTNAIGVVISVKGLEFRLSFPHLSMVYLVAFWWLSRYDYWQIKKRLPSIIICVYPIIIAVICFVWNLRYAI